jgi:hypothetical protein
VKRYYEANKLEPKALLLTENAPSHPDNFETWTSVLFWKSYNIMKAVRNIKTAWDEVSTSCMKRSWKNIWLDACNDSNNSEENVTPIINDIIHLANQLGMDEVDSGKVQELLQSYETGLTNEELMELEQQNSAVENNEDSTTDNVEVVGKN